MTIISQPEPQHLSPWCPGSEWAGRAYACDGAASLWACMVQNSVQSHPCRRRGQGAPQVRAGFPRLALGRMLSAEPVPPVPRKTVWDVLPGIMPPGLPVPLSTPYLALNLRGPSLARSPTSRSNLCQATAPVTVIHRLTGVPLLADPSVLEITDFGREAEVVCCSICLLPLAPPNHELNCRCRRCREN